MRNCSKCQKVKPYSEFHKGTAKDGYGSYCKPCYKQYYLEKQGKDHYQKPKTDSHRECKDCRQMLPNSQFRFNKYYSSSCVTCLAKKARERNLKLNYGIDLEQYEILFNAQEGVCAICHSPETNGKALSVDHNHECCPGKKTCTKCIRGLLCGKCNRTLGLINDDFVWIDSAAKYLSRTAYTNRQ